MDIYLFYFEIILMGKFSIQMQIKEACLPGASEYYVHIVKSKSCVDGVVLC